jgi:GNAT superfamily N-acetyltransferase
MSIEYRAMYPEEEDAALDLWAEVLSDDRAALKRLFVYNDRHRFEHHFVAAAPDGRLLSTVGYWLRDVRDASGVARRVGQVINVATREAARRQGHAGRLLELVIEAMTQNGCAWSLLLGREQARTLYKHYGWKHFLRFSRRGSVEVEQLPLLETYRIRLYDPLEEPAPWDTLAALYDAYNAVRPLTLVRDPRYWRGYTAARITDWMAFQRAVIFVATRGLEDNQLCGYLFGAFYDQAYARYHFNSPPAFVLSEIGVRPGDEAAIPALLYAAGRYASERGIIRGQVDLPDEPLINTALERLFGPSLHLSSEPNGLMARTIAPDFEQRALDAIFATSGSICWSIDEV